MVRGYFGKVLSCNSLLPKFSVSSGLTLRGLRCWAFSPPQVDRLWGIWGSYYDIPKAIVYLLKGGYM